MKLLSPIQNICLNNYICDHLYAGNIHNYLLISIKYFLFQVNPKCNGFNILHTESKNTLHCYKQLTGFSIILTQYHVSYIIKLMYHDALWHTNMILSSPKRVTHWGNTYFYFFFLSNILSVPVSIYYITALISYSVLILSELH